MTDSKHRNTEALWYAITTTVLLLANMPLKSQELPQYDDQQRAGVASCAASLCHGSVRAGTAHGILQNEYVTWSRYDRHANAYDTLLSEDSKRIARNLGLKNAHESDVCLDCHADNVASGARGDRFQLGDGVGCEACHGGAGNWLRSHVEPGADHAANVANGLYPLAEPRPRAQVCLSCHFGNKEKFVTHRILGAGHPRLSFELDTFSRIQPAHFSDDAEYRRRKPDTDRTRIWATGVVESALSSIDALQSTRFTRSALIPELAVFDCHACHHSVNLVRWQPRATTGNLGPGAIRLNDSSLIMALAVARTVAPEQAEELSAQLIRLHEATAAGPDTVADAAADIGKVLSRLAATADRHRYSTSSNRDILNALIATGLEGDYQDYVAAEQATMAIDILVAEAAIEANDLIDDLFAVVRDEDSYRPWRFTEVLGKLKAELELQ